MQIASLTPLALALLLSALQASAQQVSHSLKTQYSTRSQHPTEIGLLQFERQLSWILSLRKVLPECCRHL